MVDSYDVVETFLSSQWSSQHKLVAWVYKWLYIHYVNDGLLVIVVFCFWSHHRWWRHFRTCCITGANSGQVGFFIIEVDISLLLWRYYRSCFAWLNVKSDQMLMFMILNLMRNPTILYGANVPNTSLWIMPKVVYAVSSSSILAYKMFNTSMINFVWLAQQ